MDKKMLQRTFREYKKASGVAYAITNPDGLGDCSSCVNYALCKKYGEDSHGIYVKHWTRGMNGDYPLDHKDRNGEDVVKTVYIAHDLNEEEAEVFYKVFGENYNILPATYEPYRCFSLYEKSTPVWSVSYKDVSNGRKYSDEYTKREDALRRMDNLFEAKTTWALDVTLTRIF